MKIYYHTSLGRGLGSKLLTRPAGYVRKGQRGRQGKRKISWERVQEMRKAFAAGVPISTIAKNTGCSYNTAYNIVHGIMRVFR